jgi:hypothetical protein
MKLFEMVESQKAVSLAPDDALRERETVNVCERECARARERAREIVCESVRAHVSMRARE